MAVILHVDDSSFSRIQVGKVLKKAGHEVLQAENGSVALKVLTERQPDLILSDILMPEMDGMALLEALREQGNKVPVIMLTADVQHDTKDACLALGARLLLNKPPKEEELLAALDEALAQGV